MPHYFTVAANPNTHDRAAVVAVSQNMLTAILAIFCAPCSGNKTVHAVKVLREVTGIGLYEAKHTVDFIEARGRFGPDGRATIEPSEPPRVTYSTTNPLDLEG